MEMPRIRYLDDNGREVELGSLREPSYDLIVKREDETVIRAIAVSTENVSRLAERYSSEFKGVTSIVISRSRQEMEKRFMAEHGIGIH